MILDILEYRLKSVKLYLLFCYNKLCPHCFGYRYSLAADMCVKEKKIRSKDMIPHRCFKCYFLWNKKKPIYDCDFFVNFRRKITLYTVVRKYRKKSALELLADRIESLENGLKKCIMILTENSTQFRKINIWLKRML